MGTQDHDDFELLARWREGDKRAGSALFERHFQSVLRFFRSKFPRGAEDLTQKTFLVCVGGRERFRGEASVRAFLFGIARKVALQEFRARARRSNIDFDARSVADLAPRPSARMAQRADRRVLLGALRSLPVNDQILLELYHWEGLSAPELTTVLGVGEPAIRSRLRRAITRLKRAVERHVETPELGYDSSADFAAWVRSVRARLE